MQESTSETLYEKIKLQSSERNKERGTIATSSENTGALIRGKVGLKRVKDCDLTKGRFNATKMLELIRGKRLVFVGDSINRNQWESMLGMLMGAIKDPKRVYETHGRKIVKEKGPYIFKFVVSLQNAALLPFYFKAKLGQKRIQTLRIDSIDRGTSRWTGADILVFNTAHWWTHYKTKAGINYYQEGNRVHPQLDVSTAFRRALITWASWVDRKINPEKTKVFFRSLAPFHFSLPTIWVSSLNIINQILSANIIDQVLSANIT
ncbi:hypothetical protein SO802_033835, partial [Lithocarpus litseifolius]